MTDGTHRRTSGYWIGDESVRGHIIGNVEWPYEFWQDGERFARGYFENDAEAESWCREHYPERAAGGVEMRCFDGGGR